MGTLSDRRIPEVKQRVVEVSGDISGMRKSKTSSNQTLLLYIQWSGIENRQK